MNLIPAKDFIELSDGERINIGESRGALTDDIIESANAKHHRRTFSETEIISGIRE
jgi:hypothetical protein